MTHETEVVLFAEICGEIERVQSCLLYTSDAADEEDSVDLGEEDHFSFVRKGSVRLSLKFSAALANTVTAVAYAEFVNVIEVDRDRNVVFDFGV